MSFACSWRTSNGTSTESVSTVNGRLSEALELDVNALIIPDGDECVLTDEVLVTLYSAAEKVGDEDAELRISGELMHRELNNRHKHAKTPLDGVVLGALIKAGFIVGSARKSLL